MDIYDFKSAKSEQQFLEKIYEYCIKTEWNPEKLEELAILLKTNKVQIQKWIRSYAKKYMTIEENKTIDKIITDLNKKQKELEKLNTTVINPILYKEKNKVLYKLWETEEEKEIVLKYIFNYCEENAYSEREVRNLSFKLGIGLAPKRILKYAEEYATKYLKYSPEQFQERRTNYATQRLQQSYKNHPNKYKIIFQKLLETDNLEEIIKIINQSEQDTTKLKKALTGYIVVHRNGNEKEEKELKEKIDKYKEYKNQENKKILDKEKEQQQKQILPQAIKCIKYFIENDSFENIDKFCNKNNIDKKIFSKYLEIVKEKEEELYNEYITKITNIRKKRYAMMTKKIRYIVSLLKNGIEENGVVRSFDLIDYYMNTSISLKEIEKPAKEILNSSDYALLNKFIKQNLSGVNSNPRDIKMIMSEKIEINRSKNITGEYISGENEVFSNENKEKIIYFLKNNNIPLNRKTYTIAFKRYLNGFLDLENLERVIKK